jgi:hypothetical protein
MSRRCECEARMAGECMCGAWDDDSKWLQPGVDAELDQLRADRDRLATELRNVYAAIGATDDIESGRDPVDACKSVVEFGRYTCDMMLKFEAERDLALSSAEALRVECERMRAVCEAAKALYEADQVDAMSDGGLVPQCRETHDKLSALYAAVDHVNAGKESK